MCGRAASGLSFSSFCERQTPSTEYPAMDTTSGKRERAIYKEGVRLASQGFE
jgi:hypothetical protein